jgi:hypothetical protein
VLAVIWPLLGRHIAFHRRLVDLTANVKAALLLSQAIYWTRHGRDIAANGGWFVKTLRQWEMETALSAKEQATARAVLRDLSILDEKRLGVPAKLHFRLRVDRLGALLAGRIGRPGSELDWSDGAAVAALLGPSLAFHRTLAAIGGGVHAGLMLSRALHLTRLHRKRRLEAWVHGSAARWSDEIGLTRREQETARRNLVRTDLWEETLAGIPPRLMVRVRLDRLLSLLVDGGPDARPVGSGSVCASSTDRSSPKGDASPRDARILVATEAPYQTIRNGRDSTDGSAKAHIRGSTGDSVQPTAPHDRLDLDVPASRGGGLIFPVELLPEECDAAALLVLGCGDQAQALLDELSARLQARSVRVSPIAYLRGLVNRANAGAFVPELGPRVAATRRRQEEERAMREEREAEAKRLAVVRATSEHQANVAARREEIQRLLAVPKPARRREEP